MDLEKFWLGNVNEKGDVDQEGYDEETLQIVNTKASGLKNKLVDGVVDENDTRPQNTDDDDIPVEKESSAVDYSHENEAVEDDTAPEELEERKRNYRRAELAFQNSTRGGPSADVAKRKIDDDYDDEESEDEAKATLQSNELPSSTRNDMPKSDSDTVSALTPATSQTFNQTGFQNVSLQSASRAGSEPTGSMQVEQSGSADHTAQQPQEQPSKSDSIRKHGLLLFSEMFLFPSIQPRIARTRLTISVLLRNGCTKAIMDLGRANKALHGQGKVEHQSDDEDR